MEKLLFLIPVIGYMVGAWLSTQGMHEVEVVVKGLSTASLVAIAAIFINLPEPYKWFIVGAVVLTLVGDISLVAQKIPSLSSMGSTLFVVGLGSFLVGYLGYSITMFANRGGQLLTPEVGIPVLVVLAIGAGISVFQFISYTNLGEGLTVPVIAYLFQATLLLGAGALVIATSNYNLSGWLFAVGAISLYVSDSLIGWNLFKDPLPNQGEFPIMITYAIGQVGIIGALTLI
jgi:uncharacterized membrane protein YhhN